MAESQTRRGVSFAEALKSFHGYLRGSKKAASTVASYQSDLRLFEEFVHQRLSRKRQVLVSDLQLADLKRYSEYLRSQGFHDNTRRRRLLTVRRLFTFLKRRGRLEIDLGRRIPAPHKVEKVPKVAHAGELIASVEALPRESLVQERNRVLLWFLLETGCLVSEAAKTRFDQWSTQPFRVQFTGKNERLVPISAELYRAAKSLHRRAGSPAFLFSGFNRYGPLTASAITPRGVEMVVKGHRQVLGAVTPRMIRHSVVVQWARNGASSEQIRQWLGLKTDYAFRAYGPLLKKVRSSSEATSTGDKR